MQEAFRAGAYDIDATGAVVAAGFIDLRTHSEGRLLGFDESPATPVELQRMKELTARSMEEGAWGLVTRSGSGGPRHPDELLELARVVASYGGNYTSHHGSEGY